MRRLSIISFLFNHITHYFLLDTGYYQLENNLQLAYIYVANTTYTTCKL